jgi:hypothetical protein
MKKIYTAFQNENVQAVAINRNCISGYRVSFSIDYFQLGI